MSDPGRALRWDRRAGWALAASASGFALCLVWAALVYPGGNWCDPQRVGFDPVRGFFCDLLHARGLNGAPNPGAPIARAALLLAGLAFVPFWLRAPRALGFVGCRARAVVGLGASSALLCSAVALSPSDSWPTLHQLAVLSASASGVAAALLAVTAPTSGRAAGWLRRLGWVALGTAGLDAALYAEQVFLPRPCALLLPALQKLAALAILAWMLATAWVLLRRRGPGVTESEPSRTG